MQLYPLMHILFWIGLTLSPQNTTQIAVKSPDSSWTWTKQESGTGWIQSGETSVWMSEGSTVTSKLGEKVDKQDVGSFVRGIKEQNWTNSPSLKLQPKTSLTKIGNTFVFTRNEGETSAKQFVIEFKKP